MRVAFVHSAKSLIAEQNQFMHEGSGGGGGGGGEVGREREVCLPGHGHFQSNGRAKHSGCHFPLHPIASRSIAVYRGCLCSCWLRVDVCLYPPCLPVRSRRAEEWRMLLSGTTGSRRDTRYASALLSRTYPATRCVDAHRGITSLGQNLVSCHFGRLN